MSIAVYTICFGLIFVCIFIIINRKILKDSATTSLIGIFVFLVLGITSMLIFRLMNQPKSEYNKNIHRSMYYTGALNATYIGLLISVVAGVGILFLYLKQRKERKA